MGFNYRLTDFQAALGLSQLKKADKGLARRLEIAAKYDKAFSDMQGIRTCDTLNEERHAYHLYIIHCDERKELYDYLRANNIFAQVHYIPVHLHPYYQGLGFQKGQYPKAEAYYNGCLSIPMYPSLTDEEQDYVIKTIKSFIQQL